MNNITKNKKYLIAFLVSAFITTTPQLSAAWTVKKGHLVDKEKTATVSLKEHHRIAKEAFENQDYKTAAINFQIIATCFPRSPIAEEAHYFLGIALFNLEEFDFANNAFSTYIGAKSHPKFFIEAIGYKYQIAEAFKNGAKRRPFGTKSMPKWASGEGVALTIYDEVIAALPSHEYAAFSLYSKATMLLGMKQYRESVDCLQLIIKRFPKHELAPKSFLFISNIYLEQSRVEFQNPDFLSFAEINARRFKEQFPRDERIVEAENCLDTIKEVYAKGLYDTGQFYERTEEFRASIIYYQNAIKLFPTTAVAKLCEARLKCLIKN